jgi:hypothetical protein
MEYARAAATAMSKMKGLRCWLLEIENCVRACCPSTEDDGYSDLMCCLPTTATDTVDNHVAVCSRGPTT